MADAVGLRIGMPVQGPPVGAFSPNSTFLNSSTRRVAWIFYAQDTNAITHLGFRYNARTGTPPTYRASLQGVDATSLNGVPDGTVKGGGSPASGTFTPPASTAWDGTFQWVALSNSYTPSRGELLSLVIDYSSGTVDASNYGAFDYSDFGSTTNSWAIPYGLTYNGSSWSKAANQPIFGIRTASTRYGIVYTNTYDTATASTVGLRHAMKFNVPSGIAGSYTVKGFRFVGKLAGGSGKNPIAGLWTSSTTLQNVTLDSDVSASSSGTYRMFEAYFDESSLSTLTGGTDYYIGLEVADGTNGGLGIHGYTVTEANDMLAQPLGTSAFFATYNGTTWTDVTTTRPAVELILGDITPPSSGGGIMLRRNFDGGF